jgi:outer membrane receptor protein involved in Fe transport
MNYLSKTISYYLRFISTMALGALTLGYGATSYAQAEVEEVLEEIIVTGSYIPRTSLVTPTPIMMLDSGAIEGSGLTNMGDLLLELPAVNIGITPTGSQSGTDQGGLYSINLRDLGTDRTLTLVDGRRVASNRPGANLVSTNTIPDDMVERVEVITGGASAVYGSDAIAGVVNFILKDDFEGISFRTKHGQSQHGGGDKTTASLTMGSNFVQDRGNVIFNITFDKATEILGNERDYYLNDKQIRREDGVIVNEIQDVFSSTSPISRIDIAEAPSDIDRWRVEPGPEGSDRDSRTFDSFSTSEHGYNSQNFQSQFGPYERLMASTKMNFNVSDRHQLFAQAFFVSDKTDSFTNPEGLDQEDANPGISNINPDLAGLSLNYPWLPTQIRQVATDVLFNPDGTLTQTALGFGCAAGDVACANDLGIISWRKRFFSQGRRTKPNTRDTLRLATGFEGEIWQDWSYSRHPTS